MRYLIDGDLSKHYDAIKVTNPDAPERGTMQIEKEGWVTWEFTGSLDDTGISNLTSEAINTLRASGLPFRQGPLS